MDLLTTPAWKWQEALKAGKTTSRELAEACVRQIERFNHENACLNAIISTAPLDSLFAQAQKLDDERPSGLRSPLHGSPIVIKDIFITDASLGMPTTCGAAALASAVGRKNCALVEKLLSAGLIIVGKGNLSEFCGLRAKDMRVGLSSLGGQTHSPYISGGLNEADQMLGNTHPGGSSSGPAVSVAAGFAPIAIGSDTSGSLIVPANRAGLYSLRITNAKVAPMCTGMQRMSSYYDSIGAMAKSARDLADITRILLGGVNGDRLVRPNPAAFEGFSIGFVNPELWRYSDDVCYVEAPTRSQLVQEYRGAISRIEKQVSEWSKLLEEFLSSLGHSPIRSIDELIAWNEAHPELAMPEPCPNQDDLIKARDSASSLTSSERQQLFDLGDQRAYKQGIDKALRENNVELLVGPADSMLFYLAATAGCPIGTMPLSMVNFDDRGRPASRPDGLCVIRRRDSDERVLDFLIAYESVFPFRPVPPALEKETK
ncbi:hypothetical protein M409DRAFT_53365 [Zasmidium cellare ATCC 36951]|uniref:Amidase domain-containing protein n=1 Tax=Zasmidium cellare ATCC 36951 TaxID=1080233 RepID=A0A6A6CQD3_ZASCE|nr:uncharacterized protein M409DRAFT_53365 [Zasmidium cellare ATCC 36951]KAF2168032.1 hypothetical protein M409DRAFT_53365 [Zasmidium cellare ATCC 36951]